LSERWKKQGHNTAKFREVSEGILQRLGKTFLSKKKTGEETPIALGLQSWLSERKKDLPVNV
jgi:hypothetical protein